MTTQLLIWLTLLLGASLAAVAIALVLEMSRLQRSWMKILCEKQGLPATIMEKIEMKPPPAPKKDERVRISVPIPGAQLFRKP
jgi:hypothetical protein